LFDIEGAGSIDPKCKLYLS